jgi:hypothetical protein
MPAQKLPFEIRTKGGRLRPMVRTVQEAIGLIDDELSSELRSQSRWAFARQLLMVAASSNKKRDVAAAARQLRQALSNDRLLADEDASGVTAR